MKPYVRITFLLTTLIIVALLQTGCLLILRKAKASLPPVPAASPTPSPAAAGPASYPSETANQTMHSSQPAEPSAKNAARGLVKLTGICARNARGRLNHLPLPGAVVRIVSVGELFLNPAVPAVNKHLGRLRLFRQGSGGSHRFFLGAVRAERIGAALQLDQPEMIPGNHMIFLSFHHPMVSGPRTPSLQRSSGEESDG